MSTFDGVQSNLTTICYFPVSQSSYGFSYISLSLTLALDGLVLDKRSNLDLTLKILTLTSNILCCSSTATTEKFWKNTAEKDIIPHLTVTNTTTTATAATTETACNNSLYYH